VTWIETKGSLASLHRRSLGPEQLPVCLRVLWGGKWIEAETIICELRSYERSSPPRLKPALCATCEESLLRRRLQIPGERPALRRAADASQPDRDPLPLAQLSRTPGRRGRTG
jgi:hypothetical protein